MTSPPELTPCTLLTSSTNFVGLRQLASEYPGDLWSLKRGQLACFYLGRQDLMLTLAQKVCFTPVFRRPLHVFMFLVIPLITFDLLQAADSNRGAPFFGGMLAFAQLEGGWAPTTTI